MEKITDAGQSLQTLAGYPADLVRKKTRKGGQSPPDTTSESEDSEEHTADFIVKKDKLWLVIRFQINTQCIT